MADNEEVSEHTEENDENKPEMAPPVVPEGAKTKDKQSKEQKKQTSSSDKNESYPEIPYKEPSWGGLPSEEYSLELLKNGCIIQTVDLTKKPYYLFGRLPNCDVMMEHPSISRYHAIIQYKASQTSKSEQGFYLYDLGSTHGTMINKVPVECKKYYRIRVGYVIKFGGSSRLYILQGPEDIDETELQAMEEETSKPQAEVGKVMTAEEMEEWKQKKTGQNKKDDTSEGIDWGFGEDAVEDEIHYPSNFGEKDHKEEDHHFKDPKKTLRGYFEREGLELEYEVEETGPGHARVYHCRIKLPIELSNGEPMYAEAMVTGKKREAVLEGATEACRILDANGLLRQSSHESKKHKEKNWEDNDFYDSDEDTFLDRTGSIEQKRQKRMKKVGKAEETIETYESLSTKLKSVEDEIRSWEEKLQQAMEAAKSAKESEDSLDDYMSSVGRTMDKGTRMQIRRKIFDLKKEKQRLKKLVNISKPALLPGLSKSQAVTANDTSQQRDKSEIKETDNSITSGIRTPSAATEYQPTPTIDSDTKTRHPKAATETTDRNQGGDNSETTKEREVAETSKPNQDTQFAIPALPVLKKPKVKAASGSISAVLQGIHGQSDGVKGNDRSFKKRERDPIRPEEEMTPAEGKTDNPAPQKKTKKAHMYGAPTEWEAVSDTTYSSWQPPEGQTGDGKTKLNEKYGY